MSRVGGGGGMSVGAERTEKSSVSSSSSALVLRPNPGARKKRGRPKIPKSWSAAVGRKRSKSGGGGDAGRRKPKKTRNDRPPSDDDARGDATNDDAFPASLAPTPTAAASRPQLVAPQRSDRRARPSVSATRESASAASSHLPVGRPALTTPIVPALLPSAVTERTDAESRVAACDRFRSDQSGGSNRGAFSSSAATTSEDGVAGGGGDDRPVSGSHSVPADVSLAARSHPKPARPRTASLAARILSAVRSVLVATVAAATSVENGGGSGGRSGGATDLKVKTNVDVRRSSGADAGRESKRTTQPPPPPTSPPPPPAASPSDTSRDAGLTRSTASLPLSAARATSPALSFAPPPPPPPLQLLGSLPSPSSDSQSDSYPISTDLDAFLTDLVGPSPSPLPPSFPSRLSAAVTSREVAPPPVGLASSSLSRSASVEPLDRIPRVHIPSSSSSPSLASSVTVASTDASQDGAAGGDHFGTYDETRRLEFHTKCRGCVRRDRSGELLCRDCGMGRCPRCSTLWDHHGQCTFCVALVEPSRSIP